MHRRVAARTDIWLGLDGIFTRSWGELRNLSEGGAYVQTDQRFSIGSLINLRFQLPGTAAYVSGRVVVRNHREHGIGVEFIDLPEEDRRRVRDYMAACPT